MSLNDRIETLVAGKTFKKLMTKIYGWGASIVIIGTLFKIQHLPGAGFFLASGLITESIIFFFSAFEREDEPVKVYPEIINNNENKEVEGSSYEGNQRQAIGYSSDGGYSSSLALAKFDEMLEKAEITPEMLQMLGLGMKKLGETTEKMNSMGDVSAASKQYMRTIKAADESLEKLAKSYENTITKVTSKTSFKYKSISDSLSVINEQTISYQQQLELLNKNLSDLNAIYSQQKKGAYEYLKDMTEAEVESNKYRKEIKELNENLSTLNSFYGNMISAMKIK